MHRILIFVSFFILGSFLGYVLSNFIGIDLLFIENNPLVFILTTTILIFFLSIISVFIQDRTNINLEYIPFGIKNIRHFPIKEINPLTAGALFGFIFLKVIY